MRREIDKDGTIRYYNELGQYHRTDGPAIEHPSGTKYWYQNGLRHRLDGPAVEYVDGSKVWYQNNQLHRLDGPAIEWGNGYKEYWIEGKRYTEEEYTLILFVQYGKDL